MDNCHTDNPLIYKDSWRPSNAEVISTDGGMIDVHDRRPVVLSAEDAALWLDPGLPAEQAEEIARSALSHDYFEW